MRKVLAIFVLFLYLILASGISVKVHFCGDRISYIDLFPIKENSCCGIKKASCCKDYYAVLGTFSAQEKATVIKKVASTQSTEIINSSIVYFSFQCQWSYFKNSVEHTLEATFTPKLPIHILFRVIRV